MDTIAIRIKSIREDSGLSQDAFGAKIGLKKSAVSLMESGKSNPSEQTVKLICREFGVAYEWLTDGLEPMYVPQESMDLAALEHIMYGDNEYLKSIFRELAEMPVEWWEQAIDMLKRIDKQKGR